MTYLIWLNIYYCSATLVTDKSLLDIGNKLVLFYFIVTSKGNTYKKPCLVSEEVYSLLSFLIPVLACTVIYVYKKIIKWQNLTTKALSLLYIVILDSSSWFIYNIYPNILFLQLGKLFFFRIYFTPVFILSIFQLNIYTAI